MRLRKLPMRIGMISLGQSLQAAVDNRGVSCYNRPFRDHIFHQARIVCVGFGCSAYTRRQAA